MEIVVNWKWRGHEIGFYSETDFIILWAALQRLLDGDAEYESWGQTLYSLAEY